MSSAGIQNYEDPIIKLAYDPDLNKVGKKKKELHCFIDKFALSERKVSKLCKLTVKILETLERIEMKTKSWLFLSLDINSADHFDNEKSEVKIFNNNVSISVILSCKEFQSKLCRISTELDEITKAMKLLSPLDFISDSGALLTSLVLRNVRLKDDLIDKISVAYLKARLVTIGTELESMVDEEESSTILSYKTFVISLLKQLNKAIENDDSVERNECMAVIRDVESMYEVFKMEKMKKLVMKEQAGIEYKHHEKNQDAESSIFEGYEHDDYDSDMNYSLMSSSLSSYTSPMIHSITKIDPSSKPPSSRGSTGARRESLSSVNSSVILGKTSISEEMPYLMSAFSLAKNFEEDISHFKESDDKVNSKAKNQMHEKKSADSKGHPMNGIVGNSNLTHTHKPNDLEPHFMSRSGILPEKNLYSESGVVQQIPKMDASAYLNSNYSLLLRLGIRPQVVNTGLDLQSSNQRDLKAKKEPEEKDRDRNGLFTDSLKRHSFAIANAPELGSSEEVVD